jgi:hypothetical protein
MFCQWASVDQLMTSHLRAEDRPLAQWFCPITDREYLTAGQAAAASGA